ncbi:MAG: hypothetical protein ACFFDT_16170, partial [Candidatus Hodarchaeota archaeon]
EGQEYRFVELKRCILEFAPNFCSDPSVNSTEPSLIEREDRNLLIAFTHPFGSNEEIHEVVSSNWTDWSSHLVMGFPKNASSPSLVEAKCGALFIAYASYNATQISHIYLIHTTLCYRYGVGIKYPQDTGDSFFNPSRVEQGSAFVFMGEMQLNESEFTVPADNVTLVVTDTKNTWYDSDDEIIVDIQLNMSHYPQFLPILDPVVGFGLFNIPLEEFQVLFGKLPTGTILHFRIEWWYKDFNEQSKNINGSLFIELLVPQDHIQFKGNIPIPTTIGTPLVIQGPYIQGFASYGVESMTLALYDTHDIPVEPESPLHSQKIVKKVDSVLNTALIPYSQETFIFTELVKTKGVWTIYLPWLRDNTITKVVATSNGIHPRSSSELYVDKLPWDNNAPQLINLGPTQADDFPIVFSEQITDNQGSFNYGVDELTITFSYKIIDSEESWKSVSYSDSDPNWAKIGNIYNYSLSLSGFDKPTYILYYWCAGDLASPSNIATDGNQESPYCVGISSKETKTTVINNTVTIFIEPTRTTSSSETTGPPTSSTSKPGRAIGFGYLILIGTLGTIIIFYRKKRY